jgi:hypothetical protein
MAFVGAAAWRRAAVLTTSPAAMPSPASGRAPSAMSASPVVTPMRTSRSSPASASRIAKRGAHCAFGVVLVRDGRPEDGHHGIAYELLDGSPEPFEI